MDRAGGSPPSSYLLQNKAGHGLSVFTTLQPLLTLLGINSKRISLTLKPLHGLALQPRFLAMS